MSHDFLTTYSGKKFFPANPQEDQIDISDIIIGLSREPRFAGHTKTKNSYCVAEHSVRCYWIAPKRVKLLSLMHDSPEFILKDIPRALKGLLSPLYDEIEDKTARVIASKYGYLDDYLDEECCRLVKEVDDIMAATELRDFKGESFPHLPPALSEYLGEPWSAERATYEFAEAFCEITGSKYLGL